MRAQEVGVISPPPSFINKKEKVRKRDDRGTGIHRCHHGRLLLQCHDSRGHRQVCLLLPLPSSSSPSSLSFSLFTIILLMSLPDDLLHSLLFYIFIIFPSHHLFSGVTQGLVILLLSSNSSLWLLRDSSSTWNQQTLSHLPPPLHFPPSCILLYPFLLKYSQESFKNK